MRTDFLCPSDPRWLEALGALRHDTYDLPEYVAACGRHEMSTPTAFYANEDAQYALIPLLERPLPPALGAPGTWTDAVSPYGYSSALFTDQPEWSCRALAAFLETCAERSIISVFVRLHPLLASAAALASVGTVVRHGETVLVDLTLPEEALLRQQRTDHKAGIRRLRAQRFTVLVDEWSLYAPFIEIYEETMQRVGADPYYLFSNEYFQDLRRDLGTHLHLFSVLAPDGSLAAGGLFLEAEGIVEYHLSGTSKNYRQLAPAKLMLDVAIQWAKSAGNRVLHLGGGVGSRNDALFQFKAGFSNLRSSFQTWRVICDDARYIQLTEDAGVSGASIDGFFPAYATGKGVAAAK
jgi:Acetyltransferase (GNAT) domain